MVTVPACEDMDDETFFKHMNARHNSKPNGVDLVLPFRQNYSPSLVAAWRAFHRRVHMLAAPGQIEDHCHNVSHAKAVTSR